MEKVKYEGVDMWRCESCGFTTFEKDEVATHEERHPKKDKSSAKS